MKRKAKKVYWAVVDSGGGIVDSHGLKNKTLHDRPLIYKKREAAILYAQFSTRAHQVISVHITPTKPLKRKP